jgi:predicted RNase H-like HicB family nuclease
MGIMVTIETTVQIWQEGDQFIAHAMPIDVMSSGPSPQAARAALDEALHLFIRTAAEAGTLDQLLEECGYVRGQDTWISPRIVASEQYAVAV